MSTNKKKVIDWKLIDSKLPIELKDDDQVKQRSKIFEQFDPNNNGYLSLAEIDKGCRDVLQLYDIFDCKHVIRKAYMSAKSAGSKQNDNADFVERSEFRLLLVYLKQYFQLWQMFTEIDTGDNSNTSSRGGDMKDHRINWEEFQQAVPIMKEKYGWKELFDSTKSVQDVFNEIDTNGGTLLSSCCCCVALFLLLLFVTLLLLHLSNVPCMCAHMCPCVRACLWRKRGRGRERPNNMVHS